MTRGEVWRQIKGYEGRYLVSNYGKVDSILFNKRKRLKYRDKGGYRFVVLYKNGEGKQEAIHRLVATAFIDNPNPSLKEVNHKDENRSNNYAGNLEWCDKKYNMNYGTQKQRAIQTSRDRGQRVGGVPVLQIGWDGAIISEYPSIYEASRKTGINATTITKCCQKIAHRKHAGGYKWAYKYE